jgi:formate-dependent nitrite reductase membrane component NrfD
MSDRAIPQNVFMDRFDLKPKVQRVWDVPHATWFTLMGLGGGLFILARLLGLTDALGSLVGMPLVDALSFVAIAVGGIILIADLGKPFRFWRAFVNVRTSWISWGAISDAVFLTCGGLLVLPDLEIGGARPFAGLPWDSQAETWSGAVLEMTAGLAAIVVMFYAGAVLAHPRAIPYWHSPSIPLQFLASAAALSMAVIVGLAAVNGQSITDAELTLMVVFLSVLLASISWHLLTNASQPGKQESLERLLRGRYRGAFLGLVVLGGVVVPLVLAIVGLTVNGTRDALAIVELLLLAPAAFLLRLLTLRVGIFPPVRQLPGSKGAPLLRAGLAPGMIA